LCNSNTITQSIIVYQVLYVKMGSGISLGEDHIFQIIQRELAAEFYHQEKSKPKYINGYEIYYDFSEEVKWRTKVRNAYDTLLRIQQQKNTKK
jgi:hypothetical protein